MKLLRRHATWMVVLVGLVSAVVTIVGWLAPGARRWLGEQAGLAWTLVAVLGFMLAAAVKAIWSKDDDLAAEQATVEHLNSTVAHLEAEAAEIREHKPTERDKALAAEVLAIWIPTGRLFRFFEMGFNAKRWEGDQVDPLVEFVANYEHRYFDDAVVQESYATLYAAAHDLGNWMAYQAAPIDEDNRGKRPGDPLTYSIREAHIVGGWPQWDALRREGLNAATALLDASREFERVARVRGL